MRRISRPFSRVRQPGGGLGIGGWALVYRLLKSVDDYQVEILLSLALVAGGYALAEALHVSGPIAMVVAGLLIGNHGRSFAMSSRTIENLDLFWGLIDEILECNPLRADRVGGVGIDILRQVPGRRALRRPHRIGGSNGFGRPASLDLAALGVIRAVDGAHSDLGRTAGESRWPWPYRFQTTHPGAVAILTTTYVVVVCSILVQGLTMAAMTRHWLARTGQDRPGAE